ncbi:MAG: hypothetical protein AAFX76_03400, partial [Planctomycetota bacterium]
TLHADDPHDADVPYMIALEYAKDGDHAAALGWLDKTLKLDPAYHYAYFQKTKVHSAAGDAAAARAAADAGIKRATADGNTKAVGELEELRAALGG